MKPASDHSASVQLSPMAVRLTPELEAHLEAMNDLSEWSRWIAEQNSAQKVDSSCPKCSGPLWFDKYAYLYRCVDRGCGWSMPAPAKH